MKLEHPDFVKSVAVLPNGYVATGCRDENIRIWNPAVNFNVDNRLRNALQ